MEIKQRKEIIAPALISFFLHLILVVGSLFVFLPAAHMAQEKPRYINVKILKEEPHLKETPIVSQEEPAAKSRQTERLIQETELPQSFVEPDEAIKKDLSIPVPEQLQPLVVSRRDKPTKYREPLEDATVLKKKARQATRENLVETGSLPAEPVDAGMLTSADGGDISMNLEHKSPGSGALLTTGLFNSSDKNDQFQVTPNYRPGVKRVSQYSDLKGTLGFELRTYQDPKDGQRYFRLAVKVHNVMAKLPVLPKELVLLIDCSQSIDDKRLAEFKKGLTYIVQHLNKEDKFNIVAFKDKTESLSATGPLDPTDQSVKQAIQFIKLLTAGSKTDVFSALSSTVNRTPLLKPAYTFFISDGHPTKGVKDSREVINQISGVNQGKIPIFAYSGGFGVSRYLLDFIAYKNRGWSEYSDREYLIDRDLARMYDKIRDPLLINLRYNTSGLKEEELFPQILPDFFKGSELVLYGQYTAENQFILQVLGDLKDQVKEFIIEASLEKAQAGDESIARQWAFHKVYHLISLLEPNKENPEILKQIDALCDKFGIETPYSRNYR